jgi:hypothetical protein
VRLRLPALLVRGTGRRTRRGRQAAVHVLPGARHTAGEMETDDRQGHGHWHYRDAARYRLRDAAGRVVARSGKVGFCLINTHQVDLRFDARRAPSPRRSAPPATAVGPQQRLEAGWGDL